jgi:hypothetical protein
MATLSSYITEVRRLLHDANGNFYSDSELTDYINSARQRVVRDTGCLRTIQVSQTPLAPVASATQPVPWAATTAVNLGEYIFSNIFIYQVTTAGITGTEPPSYPAYGGLYPPSTPFANGTAQFTYVGNVENINYVALPEGLNTLDVLNINLYWGNSRVPLQYLPWTQFNAQLRYWQNYIGRPVAFSIFGQSKIYLSPVPDQVYVIEIDTVVLPPDLVNASTVDTIIDPYTNPVAFYAAYKAKYKEQSYGEAEIYKQEYVKQVQAVLSSVMTRRLPDPYSTPF